MTATASVPPGSEAGAASSLLPGWPGVSPLHVEWTYRVRADQLKQLRTIAEDTGLEDVTEPGPAGKGPSREPARATGSDT